MIPPVRSPRERVPLQGLHYAITDRRFFQGDERQRGHALLAQTRQLASSGVDFLQLREKDLPPADLLALAVELKRVLAPGFRPRLLLNAPLSLALEAAADGLHLPGGWDPEDLPAARRAFRDAGRPVPILSVSTHSLADVHAARGAGADLILFGPVFEKRVQGELVRTGLGLSALTDAALAAGPTPLLALGGITPESLPSCLSTGAAGVASIRLFLPRTLPLCTDEVP